MNLDKHKYFVLFKGDDSDFTGNQVLIVELKTQLDISGCSAHFKFLDFKIDFAEIPADKKLHLVFPASATSKFPMGAMDAELWLIDANDKKRTASNRIHIVVTKSIAEAYDNDDPQAITVVITGGGGSGGTVTWDSIEGKPNEFPPSAHRHDWTNINHDEDKDLSKISDITKSSDGKSLTITPVDGEPFQFSGDEQVQANWNQSNPAAPDFIKNKPNAMPLSSARFGATLFVDSLAFSPSGIALVQVTQSAIITSHDGMATFVYNDNWSWGSLNISEDGTFMFINTYEDIYIRKISGYS